MSTIEDTGVAPIHRFRPMTGRNPHEAHRAATPLELLFDLTFAISFGSAASQLAHTLAAGHFGAGLLAFATAGFAIYWAWVSFSWFSSAFDTDDWPFRLATMVQMIGVVILAIGLPRLFSSIEHGLRPDNRIMVAGYVIMRIAMMVQWLRAARQAPECRGVALTYAALIFTAQVGWVVLTFAPMPLMLRVPLFVLLMAVELATPIIAERRDSGTPWHVEHMVERYACFAIIALGEGVVGTVAALSAVIDERGWASDTVLVGLAGMGLTFGLWWVYFMLPSAAVLERDRSRAFAWSLGQAILIIAIVATGAGLDVAAYYIEGQAHISALATILALVVPVGLFLATIYALYAYMVRVFDPFHIGLLAATTAVAAAAVVAALSGTDMAICLAILTLAPVVTVIGYEVHGYRHQRAALARED